MKLLKKVIYPKQKIKAFKFTVKSIFRSSNWLIQKYFLRGDSEEIISNFDVLLFPNLKMAATWKSDKMLLCQNHLVTLSLLFLEKYLVQLWLLKRATKNLLILLPWKWGWDSRPYYHLYGSFCMLQRFDWDSQAQVLFIFWGWSLVKIPGKAFVHSTAGPAVPFAIYEYIDLEIWHIEDFYVI